MNEKCRKKRVEVLVQSNRNNAVFKMLVSKLISVEMNAMFYTLVSYFLSRPVEIRRWLWTLDGLQNFSFVCTNVRVRVRKEQH